MRDVGTFASYPTDLLKEQSRVIACSIKDPIKACFISMYLSLSLSRILSSGIDRSKNRPANGHANFNYEILL